jgi:hypothetical protein
MVFILPVLDKTHSLAFCIAFLFLATIPFAEIE